jgi:hypothetical protein
MGVNHTRRLKPFKSFLTERYRNAGQQRALGKALNEEQSEDTLNFGCSVHHNRR